jgi:hypothetical protein
MTTIGSDTSSSDFSPTFSDSVAQMAINPSEAVFANKMAASSEPTTFISLSQLESSDSPEPAPATPQQSTSSKPRKRKSWGQELPVPKTNLPPRKRAKTAEEKEQRQVERVLRNRQAAANSRERKRIELEELKIDCVDWRFRAEVAIKVFEMLGGEMAGQLKQIRAPPVPQPVVENAEEPPAALTQEQMVSLVVTPAAIHEAAMRLTRTFGMARASPPSPASMPTSVDVTPNLTVADSFEERSAPSTPTLSGLTHASASFSDFSISAPATVAASAKTEETQHSAAMLCFDLQCPSHLAAAASAALTPRLFLEICRKAFSAMATSPTFSTSRAPTSLCSRSATKPRPVR